MRKMNIGLVGALPLAVASQTAKIKHPVDLEAEAREKIDAEPKEPPAPPPPPNTSYKGYPSRQVYRWAMRKGYR